jgi:hypothetical protein
MNFLTAQWFGYSRFRLETENVKSPPNPVNPVYLKIKKKNPLLTNNI